MLNRKVVTIGISGASCSGKTTLARWLVKILPNTKIFYQDDFFKPEKEIPIDPVTNLENWDCPEAIDFNSFVKVLHQLRTTGTLPSTFNSKESKNERKDIETIELNSLAKELSEKVENLLKENHGKEKDDDDDEWNFLLVDGFLLYVNQDIMNELDIKLFVNARYDTLKHRRETRSGYVTLEGYWVDPPNYFDKIVWPSYVKANKHILDKIEKGEERLKNLTRKIDDLIILESDHISTLSKNVETAVMTVLDHIGSKKKSLD
ncbi:P-loop containing nucleoside triphosphate hydrolase protein [Glomus cerebriforme]|uniref:P-loop containing nucleoside triphosphate hydrolase protein n=1 Tax=Glomus cerebriforme TaxID=658196 RepID=A0A397SD99_9GLOM|nr:P-loop containing nucleoside triphosphate hydrolase protein [Glomus cerebriforme]